ncbi:MAG: hypothetical protein E6I26_09565 [Chloroflexi bacterium]|nr:MAG: hypothetical protein E6I26_09565 [Chloroflexota bacterium]
MRRALTLLAPFVLVLATAAPASAAPPTREPFQPLFVEFAPFEVCDFAVRIETTELNAKSITFDRRDGQFRQNLNGRIVEMATNLETGASATFNSSGPGKVWLNEAGHVVARFGGSSLIFFFDGDVTGRGLLYMTGGGAELEIGDGGFFYSRVEFPAHVVDVCALLSAD